MTQGIHIAQNRMICAQQRTPTAWLEAARISLVLRELAAAGPASKITLCDSRHGTGAWSPLAIR